jgi:hypothetical protein
VQGTKHLNSHPPKGQNGASEEEISSKQFKSTDGRTRGVNARWRPRWSPPPPSSPQTSPPMSRAGPLPTCSTCTKAASYLPQQDNWLRHNSRRLLKWRGEQIAVWHARLRTIFERAFPGENIQGSRLLINKFVLKLADSNIRQWTHRANPATYNAAMTAASNEAASQSILAHEAITGEKGNVAINVFGSRRGACHGCGSYNHHIANCPKHCPDCYRNMNKPRGRGQP